MYVNTAGISTGTTWCTTGYTDITLTENQFNTGDTVYVQNLFLLSGDSSTKDFSGAYDILCKTGNTIKIDLPIETSGSELGVAGCSLKGFPIVSYYRGIQLSILRVNGDDNSTFNQRYDITYKII